MTGLIGNYLERLAAASAARTGLRSRKLAKLPRPTPPKKAKLTPASIEARKELAFGAFPNHFGNYLGKREPKAEPRPLTARERFFDLVAMHECRAKSYRWKRRPAAAV